jgi:hypothetical protein
LFQHGALHENNREFRVSVEANLIEVLTLNDRRMVLRRQGQ